MSQLSFNFEKARQLRLLFPSTPSANQELLETLKREYSQTWLSESEKRDLAQAIQDEKNRPVSTNIYAS